MIFYLTMVVKKRRFMKKIELLKSSIVGINKTVFVLIDVSIKQMGNSFFNISIENVVFGFYRNSL
ncbi:hypothetical protein LIC_10542 [Leptospira interrogans serovar Copenhageni str. Fiocruz L1-130]|uniref:Uncharacterized protein n=2 Tax=Leptospira interrogans serogroup Icterohaemorrhagiae serovar copenhageni TaxID=44275 RepID=Q72UW5_LEPIC|nr:hypothetical protein LIC_10542 [Leptospira interrogans serovar Copenhageni str. Fiocruz L1-130]